MKLKTRITLGAAGAIALAGLVTFLFNAHMYAGVARRNMTRELMNVAKLVAQFPEIHSGLRDSPFDGTVQSRVQHIIDAIRGVDQITVCNMQRIRYSHNNPEFIGLVQEGDDIREVMYQAKSYVSPPNSAPEGYIRAYAPVFDGTEQIGFVIAGANAERLRTSGGHMSSSSFVYMLAGLSVGLIVAALLGHRASRNLLGLEPEEITKVYREHAGMIEAMHEGVVAINNRGRISLVNSSARRLLDLGDKPLEGLEIDRVIPNPRLPTVIATGEAEFEYEKRINDRVFIANMVPIRSDDRVVGAVETFQDRTQIMRMAEELIGIKQLVQALRASSHEFSNKLHVILGLLELGDSEQAKKYVQATQSEQGKIHTHMLRAFREPMIAGLMLGKISAAREQGVILQVTPESKMGAALPNTLAHSIVLVLGNLIDNAVDAVRGNPDKKGTIIVDVSGGDGGIRIRVQDDGPGVAAENLERIFIRGFSTKGEARGTGLHLVRQEITLLEGDIRIESRPGKTVFTAELPLPPAGQNDSKGQA